MNKIPKKERKYSCLKLAYCLESWTGLSQISVERDAGSNLARFKSYYLRLFYPVLFVSVVVCALENSYVVFFKRLGLFLGFAAVLEKHAHPTTAVVALLALKIGFQRLECCVQKLKNLDANFATLCRIPLGDDSLQISTLAWLICRFILAIVLTMKHNIHTPFSMVLICTYLSNQVTESQKIVLHFSFRMWLRVLSRRVQFLSHHLLREAEWSPQLLAHVSEILVLVHAIRSLVSRVYSIPLLLLIMAIFASIITQTYRYANLMFDRRVNEYYVEHLWTGLPWFAFNCVELWLLVDDCFKFVNYVDDVKRNIIRKSICAKYEYTPSEAKDVKALCLLTLHFDTSLTAAGFFNIDRSLIFSVVATGTMYTVWFLQFETGI